MAAILLLGFLIGIQHALDADHVAAMASLATRKGSLRQTARQGVVWGLGHSVTLLLFGGSVLLLDGLVPEGLARVLELLVGIMLVLLGIDVLRRVVRDRIHFHAHRHGERVHIHAHGHSAGVDHASDTHQHEHVDGFPLRALMVGMMHGMAGSAALIVLTLQSVDSPLIGLGYILLFGLGSILGMALLALAISLPLRYSARNLTWAHNGMKALVGLLTIGLGSALIYRLALVEGVLL